VDRQTTKITPWCWEATAAVCCFSGGIAAAIAGSVLTTVTWFVGGDLHPWLRGTGTGLLILTIPLLIMAGYCLDWLENKSTNSKNKTSLQGDSGRRNNNGG